MSAMTPREAAGVLAQCKWLRDQITETEDAAKAALLQSLEGGERAKALMPNGISLGSVSVVEGRKLMQVDNEDGFLAWVKQRYPTEVVESVRPAFLKVCEDKVKALGHLPDANGELCPHVSLVQWDSYAKVNLDKGADAIMQDMVTRRHLPDMLQIGPIGTVRDGLIAIEHADNPLLPTLDEVYEGPLEDTTLPHMRHVDDPVTPEVHTEIEQDYLADTESEPFIEEGPPNWQESNTFETSEAVKRRR